MITGVAYAGGRKDSPDRLVLSLRADARLAPQFQAWLSNLVDVSRVLGP